MPSIIVFLDDEANRLLEVYKATRKFNTKADAINKLIIESRPIILGQASMV